MNKQKKLTVALIVLVSLMSICIVCLLLVLVNRPPHPPHSPHPNHPNHPPHPPHRHDSEHPNHEPPIVEVHTPSRIAIDANAGCSEPETYPQLGYLKDTNATAGAAVLPVYGRSSIRNGRGYYYTIVPGSGIKVPLHTMKRNCMEEVGCEELLMGDQVTIPDMDASATWSVVMYKYNRLTPH